MSNNDGTIQKSLLTISLIIITFLLIIGLFLPTLVSKMGTGTANGQEAVKDAYITKTYCLEANLDATDANKCKDKYYTAAVKKTPQTDMPYINLDLLNKFEAGKLGTTKLNPLCKINCAQTLEIYSLIDQMNKYIKDNGFYVVNETPE